MMNKCRNTTVFWSKTFLVQCQKDFCTNRLKSLFSFVCIVVDFRDYHGICLFDTSRFFSNMFGVLVHCYLIAIFRPAVSQRLFAERTCSRCHPHRKKVTFVHFCLYFSGRKCHCFVLNFFQINIQMPTFAHFLLHNFYWKQIWYSMLYDLHVCSLH